MMRRIVTAMIVGLVFLGACVSGCLDDARPGAAGSKTVAGVNNAHLSSDGKNVTVVIDGFLRGTAETLDRENITVRQTTKNGETVFKVDLPTHMSDGPSTANLVFFTEEIVLGNISSMKDGTYVVKINDGTGNSRRTFDIRDGVLSVPGKPAVYDAVISEINDSLFLHLEGHLNGNRSSFDVSDAVVRIEGDRILVTATSVTELETALKLDLPLYEADIPLGASAGFKPGTYTVIMNGDELTKIIITEDDAGSRTISCVRKAPVRSLTFRTENNTTVAVVSGLLAGRNEAVYDEGITVTQTDKTFRITLPTTKIINRPNTRDLVGYERTITLGENLPKGNYTVEINTDSYNMVKGTFELR